MPFNLEGSLLTAASGLAKRPLNTAQEGSGYGTGAGEAGEAGGGGGGGGGFDFGVDPNLDPELALALRVSLEEERARLGGQAGALHGPGSDASADWSPCQPGGWEQLRVLQWPATLLHLPSRPVLRRCGAAAEA